jgi:hypothetical protein
MLPYLLPLPTPLIPLPYTSNGRGMHRFVPTTITVNIIVQLVGNPLRNSIRHARPADMLL